MGGARGDAGPGDGGQCAGDVGEGIIKLLGGGVADMDVVATGCEHECHAAA